VSQYTNIYFRSATIPLKNLKLMNQNNKIHLRAPLKNIKLVNQYTKIL
jgi:hypothetical protein